MIIRVKQVKSEDKNKFKVRVNGELKYLGSASWKAFYVGAPGDISRNCSMTDTDENLLFKAKYDAEENLAEGLALFKVTLTGERRRDIFNVNDGEGNLKALLYKAVNGAFDTKYIIEYGDYILKGYDKSVGKTRNVSIYKDDQQIAELVKPMSVTNNLDEYYIFLLDEYAELEQMLAFFGIYFDCVNYTNSGEHVKSKTAVSVEYSFDRNGEFYNKKWIPQNFSKEEVEAVYNAMNKKRDKNKKKIKKQAKITLLLFGIAWLVVLIILGLMFYFNML